MTDHDLINVRLVAERELANEAFRAQVEAHKARLKARRSFWNRLFNWFPYRIVRK